MTRERYETLSLASLKEIAKAREIKGISSMNKSALIDAMVLLDEKLEADAQQGETNPVPVADNVLDAASDSDNREKANSKRTGKKTSVKKATDRNADDKNDSKPVKKAKSASADKTMVKKKADTANSDSNDSAETKKVSSENKSVAEKQPSIETGKMSSEIKQEQEKAQAVDKTDNAEKAQTENEISDDKRQLDSGNEACGILEVLSEGYGFIRSANYLPGEDDVYVAPSQIRRFGLKTGDIIVGNTRVKSANDKFGALLFLKTINGLSPQEASKRKNFEDLTPIFPDEKLRLETPGGSIAMRIMDLMCPVGKGQRGMIVSPPKAGKTTLLKDVAKSITRNNPEMHLIILLIDERPEEVTDIKESIEGDQVEVIYSTFDELPEHHKRVSEMVIERAKRLVEHGKDVTILLDSITRLTRAYNLTVSPSGRTLSGGLDPAALHMPKRFFGAARNMREGGSLTILATALIDTGSKMDDVVYEEFKGTGNMEMVLDRKLSERRVFPAIDIPKSGTRRDDLLIKAEDLETINTMRKAFNGLKPEESVEKCMDFFVRTRNNREFIELIKKIRPF